MGKKHIGFLALTLTIIVVTLQACTTFYVPPVSATVRGQPETLAAQTMMADSVMVSILLSVTPSPKIPTPVLTASFTALPSSTSISLTSTSIVTPLPPLATPNPGEIPFVSLQQTPTPCTNSAEFIADITIPDDTEMKPGQKFTKTWRFRNNGTCTWTTQYAIVLVAGSSMGAPKVIPFPTTVNPGEIFDLSINMVAPYEIYGQQGNWMFQDPNGKRFGTGADAKGFFWVSIDINLGSTRRC
jgi:hypothetical protein